MKRFIYIIMLGLFLLFSSTLRADVPGLINFQGLLTDTTGGPVADGNYSVTFGIYDSLSGGNLLWQETQSIATVGGRFTAELGTIQPLDESIFSEPDRWLGIEVGADPEITPRTRLSSVPHSFKVGTVDDATGGEVTGDLLVDGNVGIGTTSPASPLEIAFDNISSTSPAIAINNTVGGGQDVIDFKFNGVTQGRIRQANGGPLLVGMVTNNDLNLITNNTTRMTVSNTGNVGIGTTSPTELLDVVGSGGAGMALRASTSGQVANFQISTPDRLWFLQVRGELSGNPFVIRDGTAGEYRLAINSTGNVGIGTTGPAYKLEVSGPVMLEDASAPSFSAGHSGIYSSGGELFALDAAGNSTLLSPHDPETGEWIFYSKNLNTGRVVRIDMERLVRKFEEITGEKFITEELEN